MRDLTFLPLRLQQSAVHDGDEVAWPPNDTREAVIALADSGRVVLGLDVRDYGEDGRFFEHAWSAFEPADVERGDVPSASREAALDALTRLEESEHWASSSAKVLVTWSDPGHR